MYIGYRFLVGALEPHQQTDKTVLPVELLLLARWLPSHQFMATASFATVQSLPILLVDVADPHHRPYTISTARHQIVRRLQLLQLSGRQTPELWGEVATHPLRQCFAVFLDGDWRGVLDGVAVFQQEEEGLAALRVDVDQVLESCALLLPGVFADPHHWQVGLLSVEGL